jgi:predicted nucleotidyltransferase component of viral defense system
MQLTLQSGKKVEAADVADALGLPSPDLIIKDFYVVSALRAIYSLDSNPFKMIFAGGTALARAHGLTMRMSEDLDLKVVPEKELSRSTLTKALKVLRTKTIETLTKTSLTFVDDTQPAHVRNEARYVQIQLKYPGAPAKAMLRPEIQMEFTFSQLRMPPVQLPIRSFAAQAADESPEIASAACCSLSETAAEKVVSLTRRVASHIENPERAEFDKTLIRHLYDLRKLSDNVDAAQVSTLAAEIAAADAAQFGNQYPKYARDPGAGTQTALRALETEKQFREQYATFQAAMVYGPHIDYDDALEATKMLASKI